MFLSMENVMERSKPVAEGAAPPRKIYRPQHTKLYFHVFFMLYGFMPPIERTSPLLLRGFYLLQGWSEADAKQTAQP